MKKILFTISILLIINVLSFAQNNFPYRYGMYATAGFGAASKTYSFGGQYKLTKSSNLWLHSNFYYTSSPSRSFNSAYTEQKNDTTNASLRITHNAKKYRLNLGLEDIRSLNNNGTFQWNYGIDFGVNFLKLTPKIDELDFITVTKVFSTGSSLSITNFTEVKTLEPVYGAVFNKTIFTLTPHIGLGYKIANNFWLRSELSIALSIVKKQGNWSQNAEDFSFNPLILQYYFGETKSK